MDLIIEAIAEICMGKTGEMPSTLKGFPVIPNWARKAAMLAFIVVFAAVVIILGAVAVTAFMKGCMLKGVVCTAAGILSLCFAADRLRRSVRAVGK